jgi:hypothetical protein
LLPNRNQRMARQPLIPVNVEGYKVLRGSIYT